MRSLLFITGFLAYVMIMAFIGFLATRKKSDGRNFLDGGRNVNKLLLIGTLGATMIGTGSSIGATANGFLYGWGGSILGLGLALGMLTMLIFVPLRRYDLRSMTEEIKFFYGGSKRMYMLLSIMLFFVEIIWVASHINGGSKYLCFVTGLAPLPAKTIITIAFLAYAIFGGYLAVIWTDTVQFGIIIVGFLTVLFRAYASAGGAEAIRAAYISAGNAGALGPYGLRSYGTMRAVSLVLSTFFGVVAVPCFHTRIFSAKDQRDAKISVATSSLVSLLFSILPSVLGMCAFTIAAREAVVLESADYTFSYIATTVLPPFAGLLFLIAGFSATLSSADSDLVAGVTIMVEDIYTSFTGKRVSKERYKAYSRVAMVIATAVAYLLALRATDIIAYTTNVVGALLPGVGVCMLMGRLWKRATWQGGFSCILLSLLFGVLYLCIPAVQAGIVDIFGGPAIPATLIACCAGIVVSLMTPVNEMTEEERLREVREMRE